LSQIDPTDHALATIASILDENHREPEQPVVDDKPLAPEPIDPDGYCKFGPGPMAAIRFKWVVQRAEDGQYHVHETIGENSAPIVSGPMTGEAAIRFVDERERGARQRFEALRSEIAGRAAVAELVRNDGGEA
jgi:hypothetical protein